MSGKRSEKQNSKSVLRLGDFISAKSISSINQSEWFLLNRNVSVPRLANKTKICCSEYLANKKVHHAEWLVSQRRGETNRAKQCNVPSYGKNGLEKETVAEVEANTTFCNRWSNFSCEASVLCNICHTMLRRTFGRASNLRNCDTGSNSIKVTLPSHLLLFFILSSNKVKTKKCPLQWFYPNHLIT